MPDGITGSSGGLDSQTIQELVQSLGNNNSSSSLGSGLSDIAQLFNGVQDAAQTDLSRIRVDGQELTQSVDNEAEATELANNIAELVAEDPETAVNAFNPTEDTPKVLIDTDATGGTPLNGGDVGEVESPTTPTTPTVPKGGSPTVPDVGEGAEEEGEGEGLESTSPTEPTAPEGLSPTSPTEPTAPEGIGTARSNLQQGFN